jgi:hypothetical protein
VNTHFNAEVEARVDLDANVAAVTARRETGEFFDEIRSDDRRGTITTLAGVAGTYEICGATMVQDGYDRCSRVVCGKHYDAGTGYCTDCLVELGEPPSGGRGERDYPDGVDGHRF